MKIAPIIAFLLSGLLISGCSEKKNAGPPVPFSLTEEAMGRYCGMNILEHAGPKGQVILSQIPEPIWFSSARDTLAFTMLPEEPKDIAAIYVSDMAEATTWEEPGADNWIDARTALFVIGSGLRGGMGADEAVPFSTREAADKFVGEHGGRVVGFGEVPRDYVLGSSMDDPEMLSTPENAEESGKGETNG
jgi:copper chaperone NosL